MTENYVQRTKYKYDLNSNLVISGAQNRGAGGGGGPNENEPTGEADSLVGKRMANFGDLAQREKPPGDHAVGAAKDQSKRGQKEQDKKKKQTSKDIVDPKKNTRFELDGSDSNILKVQIQEDLVYRPKTKETRLIYEQFLSIVQRHMGDVSTGDLKSAADEVLAILKTEDLNDNERKREIEGIVDRLSDEAFNTLTVFAQQMVDYSPEDADEYRGELREEIIDVNVELDDESEEGSEGQEQRQEDEEDKVGEEVDIIQEEDDEQEDMKDELKMEKKDGALDINEIDAQWLNRILGEQFPEQMAEETLELEGRVMKVLGLENPRESEKKLFGILGVEKFELISLLVRNKGAIYYGSLLKQAQTQSEKKNVTDSMENSKEGRELLGQLLGEGLGKKKILEEVDNLTKKYKQPTSEDVTDMLSKRVTDEILEGSTKSQKVLDFDHLQFQQGARLMANKKCMLPKGSQRITKTGYEEIYVPAVRHKFRDGDSENRLIPISELPEWARQAFPHPITNLNYIQSRVYNSAFNSNENLLICAPTGAGKTNIALLTIMQVLGQKRRTNGKFDIKNFKIVYIAPMKALVTEIVGNFQKRLADFGITVRELTGDVHLTKSQIEETQIIVTTPEKWDIITRKSGDRAYLELVKLIIIDEIHLLHDLRGPVLEAIVARTIRQIETTSEMVRIVALSATLPNYQDVAAFLRVKPESGLFYFDNSFRPVPLEQIYVGVSEKKAIKRLMLMNEICYEKVIERAGKHQILVFVHSRKETSRTAKIIRDMALAKDELHKFIGEQSETREVLQQEAQTALSQDLKDLLPYGVGIHHAGLARKDRLLVEQLFAAGHLQVLVSTATLAWGVNLPAHTVIIKGTQIYSPEQGRWVELSPQDMLQMMGRAGRPQYDTLGEGIIITNHSELQYHLSLNNQQLPIESQLIAHLADQLNAEIVLGTVSNVKEAVNWLAYTYLYVRMLRSPALYGLDEVADLGNDPFLVQRRADLIHTAAMLLSKAGMIKYDKRTGSLQANAIGKVASHYYIKHNSMSIYNENLKAHMNIIDVFRLFALSKEFQFIPIRENEKLELQKFIDKVPVPVKGSLEETASKINILLQAFISRFKLEGYDLNADMVYVTQSAGRIFRCLFEIAIKRGWAQMAETLLNCCKMVERRQWSSMTPLRQYQGLPEEILRKIEKKEQFTWQHFYDMSAQQIGEIVKFPKMGKIIHRLVHQFPRLELEAYVQPLTQSVIRVELAVNPDFQWEAKIHGKAEPFWVIVEDSDSEQVLHVEQFILKEKYAKEQHILSFIVPLYEPKPPQYFIKVISDRWLQCETVLPVSFKHLILPSKFDPPTQLQDMHSKLVRELNYPEAEQIYLEEGVKEFNAIVTQTFNKLYTTDEHVFVGAPTGSKITTCAELAILREIQSENFDKIVYVSPVESLAKLRLEDWKRRLGHHIGLSIDILTGNLQTDLNILNKSDIIIASSEKWDMLSRKWRQRKAVQRVGLYILDQMQVLDPTYEVVASRIRVMQSEIQRKIRIVALSTPLANAKDVANWLGIQFPSNTFNFHPSVRPTPLEIHIQGFDHNNKAVRLLAMQRPAYNHIKRALSSDDDSQALVFVSDRKQARLTALDFTTFINSEATRKEKERFLGQQQSLEKYFKEVEKNVKEVTLSTTLEVGVGYLHDGMSDQERDFVKKLYKQGSIRVLIAIYSQSWSIDDLESNLVVILDAEKFDGQEHRSIEYSIPDMLQMMGRANLSSGGKDRAPNQSAKCVIFCHTPRKEYFIKFLQEPYPIESALDHELHDHLNADVVAGTVENKQDAVDWITWTFMYRRISQNPNYYNMAGRTGQHINDFLSELVETTVEDLQRAKCIQTKDEDEMALEPANLGRIAAFYYIKYQTIELFSKSLEDEAIAGKKMKYILEVLSKATEFQEVAIRQGEANMLASLVPQLTYPVSEATGEQASYNTPECKTNILLQCHFNRSRLNPDLRIDQRFILQNSIKLVHAMVDVISSHGYLKPALLTMELSQMLVQAMWVTQSPLLQLPYLDFEAIAQLKKESRVEDIVDFMNMDDGLRAKILSHITEAKMQKIAEVCNRYPNIEMELALNQDRYQDGEMAEVTVTVRRPDLEDGDQEELKVFAQPVFAQYYPGDKDENWWVVIGSAQTNKLLSIKKVTNFKAVQEIQVKLNFVVKNESASSSNNNELTYQIYLICDSYIGCDQEDTFKVKLA